MVGGVLRDEKRFPNPNSEARFHTFRTTCGASLKLVPSWWNTASRAPTMSSRMPNRARYPGRWGLAAQN